MLLWRSACLVVHRSVRSQSGGHVGAKMWLYLTVCVILEDFDCRNEWPKELSMYVALNTRTAFSGPRISLVTKQDTRGLNLRS